MPASRCVAQDCNNGSNPREGISLHNSQPYGSVLSSWKGFVSLHRKNFNPTGRFVVCSEHITDDCFARSCHVGRSMKRLVQGAIPSVWKKKLKTKYLLVIVALLHKLTILSFARRKRDILVRTYSVFRHTYNLCLHVHV